MDEILNEILIRYNKVPQLIIRERIDLRKLAPKIYEKKQKERNLIFKKIVNTYFNEEIKSVHLGTLAYSIEFSDKSFVLSNKEIRLKSKYKLISLFISISVDDGNFAKIS